MSIETVGSKVIVIVLSVLSGLLAYKAYKNVLSPHVYTSKAYVEVFQEQFKQHQRELLIQYYEMKLSKAQPSHKAVVVTVAGDRMPLRWWEKPELCKVAVVMIYDDNIRKLRDFLDAQLAYKKMCGSKEVCAAVHHDAVRNIDKYLKRIVKGDPQDGDIGTSYVERQNLTMRMGMRRFTRLTNAFSKKLENLTAAVALHFAYYNFCRPHASLKGCTPAMEAGLTDTVWSLEALLEGERPVGLAQKKAA